MTVDMDNTDIVWIEESIPV